jgi:predicted enzyme related to lactoylglutathione lyase
MESLTVATGARGRLDTMRRMDAIGSVNGLVIDGADSVGLATFWAAVFGSEIEADENDGHYVDVAANGRTPVLRFQRVPETKTVKNRLHLDVEVEDLFGAIASVEAFGGSVVHDVRTEYGWEYPVMSDPEDNEFCLIHRSGV